MSSSIKKVTVIGASGNIGRPITSALLATGFTVSALTRQSSSAIFPSNVTVIKTDYSISSLLAAFKNQDAVISAIATFSTSEQASIVEAAARAGIKRFIPSEYGIDTSDPSVADVLPITKAKRDTIALLRQHEASGMSWTAICVGAFFDFVFGIPGLMGWDIPGRKAIIFDDGKYEYEATNVDQIAKTVISVLKEENLQETENKYVYVNSFTITQNQVLAALEKIIGDKFEVQHAEVAKLSKRSLLKDSQPEKHGLEDDALYDNIFGGYIVAAIYGQGGFNNFSKTKGLWNEKLGLPKDDLEDTLTRVLKDQKLIA